jgi:hypothetical protein
MIRAPTLQKLWHRQKFWFRGRESGVKLYVEPMDVHVVDVRADGHVRLEREDWSRPTLQEQRAIIYAARLEREALTELLEILEGPDPSSA